MTLDRLPLLDAMDAAADLLRTADPDSPADDELIFRRLQKERLPGLDREQFQTLYAEWQDQYAAKAAQDRNTASPTSEDRRRVRARECTGGSVRVPVRRSAQ